MSDACILIVDNGNELHYCSQTKILHVKHFIQYRLYNRVLVYFLVVCYTGDCEFLHDYVCILVRKYLFLSTPNSTVSGSGARQPPVSHLPAPTAMVQAVVESMLGRIQQSCLT